MVSVSKVEPFPTIWSYRRLFRIDHTTRSCIYEISIKWAFFYSLHISSFCQSRLWQGVLGTARMRALDRQSKTAATFRGLLHPPFVPISLLEVSRGIYETLGRPRPRRNRQDRYVDYEKDPLAMFLCPCPGPAAVALDAGQPFSFLDIMEHGW